MKRSEGQGAHLPVNGFFHISSIFLLSLFVFCGPGYGGTDIPVHVTTTFVVVGAAAVSAGIGGSCQGIVTAADDSTAASLFVAEFHDEEAGYTETELECETKGETIHTAPTQCQDSCPL